MVALAKKRNGLSLRPYSVYNLRCPHCDKLNFHNAVSCWNCSYSFAAEKEKAPSHRFYLWIWLVLGFLLIGWLAVVYWVSLIG